MTDRTIPIYFSTPGNLSPETMNLEQDKIGQLIALEMLVSSLPGAEALPIFSPGNPLPYIPVVHCHASMENQGINIKQPS